MTDQTPPATIDECAQIAHGLILRRTGDDTALADIIRRGIHDAYRAGQAHAAHDLEERISLQVRELNARSTASIRWAERAREAEQRVAELEKRLDRARRHASFLRGELYRERTQRETAQDYRRTAVWNAIAEVLAAKAPTRGLAEDWADEVMGAIREATP